MRAQDNTEGVARQCKKVVVTRRKTDAFADPKASEVAESVTLSSWQPFSSRPTSTSPVVLPLPAGLVSISS